MFIFNFIGIGFAPLGFAAAFIATWPMSGLFADTTFASVLAGAFLASALDFRYRWIGEDAPLATSDGTTMTGYISDTAGSIWRLVWNFVWPWSGAHLLFVPIWIVFPGLIALDACGYLSFLHGTPKITV